MATTNNRPMQDSSKPLFCQFDSLHQRTRLIDGFLKLSFWNRICDNSTAGLNVGLSVLDYQRPDGNTAIQVPREIQIENGASIDATSIGLELINNLHGSHFGSSCYGSCRKAGHQSIKPIDLLSELSTQ